MEKAEIEELVQVVVGKVVREAVSTHERELLPRIVRTSVYETLVTLGINPNEPHEVQRDTAFVRELRLSITQAKRHGIMALWSTILLGIAGLIYMSLRGGGSP